MSKYQAGQTVQVFQHSTSVSDYCKIFNHIVPIGAACKVIMGYDEIGKTKVEYNNVKCYVLNSDIVLHESSTNYKPEPRTYTEEEVKVIAEKTWVSCTRSIIAGNYSEYSNFDSFWQANKPQ